MVECKLYNNKASVGRPIVQKLHSAIIDSHADSGIIITTGKFAKPAIEYASDLTNGHDHPIELFDMHKIRELAYKAGIELLSDQTEKIYTYPIPEPGVIARALRPSIDNLDSQPTPAADLMRVTDTRAILRAMYFVSVSVQQAFKTSVGVVHVVDVRDERYMFDGETGKPDWSAGEFFGNPTVDAAKLPEEHDRTGFMLDDVTLRKCITEEVIDVHTESVRYRGRNNSTYTKKCVPSARNVHIDNLRQAYVPRYDVVLKTLNQNHACGVEYNGAETKLLNPTWGHCAGCRAGPDILCNECGRVAHTSWFGAHGHRCSECGKTVCWLCVWSTRRFLFFKSRFCSDCKPDNAKRDAE